MPTATVAAALLAISAAQGASLAGEITDSWGAYLKVYVSDDGRVIDYRGGSVSTSEGQSYAMVRALWMDDRGSFDRTWAWTNANLQGGDPSALPAWLWGKDEQGEWRVLDPQPASDADQLMAWALLGAADRWEREDYREQALALLDSIWREEVEEVGKYQVVLPGPWALGLDPARLNPSYFLPFALRAFEVADPSRGWGRILDDGYELLAACRSSTGLPTDWCYVDRATGEIQRPVEASHDNFGFEAFRVAWTLAAEIKWHRERRARALIGPYFSLLSRPAEPVKLPAVIGPDGRGLAEYEYPGMLGALVPAWAIRRPAVAARIWREKLAPTRAQHGWGDPNDYYGQNWIWFGLALWQLKESPV